MKSYKNIEDVAVEVHAVIENFDDELKSKIPQKLVLRLEELSKKTRYEFYIDPNKKIEDLDLDKQSKDLLAWIYYKYVADEKEKIELKEIWKENEKKEEEEKQEKYKINFSNEIEKNGNSEEKAIIVKQEKWYEKIRKFLKRLFGKTK